MAAGMGGRCWRRRGVEAGEAWGVGWGVLGRDHLSCSGGGGSWRGDGSPSAQPQLPLPPSLPPSKMKPYRLADFGLAQWRGWHGGKSLRVLSGRLRAVAGRASACVCLLCSCSASLSVCLPLPAPALPPYVYILLSLCVCSGKKKENVLLLSLALYHSLPKKNISKRKEFGMVGRHGREEACGRQAPGAPRQAGWRPSAAFAEWSRQALERSWLHKQSSGQAGREAALGRDMAGSSLCSLLSMPLLALPNL